MKKVIIVCLCLAAVGCEKKRCYECTTVDYSKMGTTPQPFEKCGTNNQIERFVKKNTHRENADTNVISQNDIITKCILH